MNFRFSNLLGAPYRGGNIVLHAKSQLYSATGNRVSLLDLHSSECSTFPFENGANVSFIAVSPSGVLLLSVDDTGRALLINVKRRALLHHFSFKSAISAVQFSPDGRFFAVGVSNHVQIWQTPTLEKSFAPFHLLRTFPACHDSISCLAWTEDSKFVACGSRDLSIRIYSCENLVGYTPPLLTGFRDAPIAVFFVKNAKNASSVTIYALSADGAIFVFEFDPKIGTSEGSEDGVRLDHGEWRVAAKHFFFQGGSTLVSAAWHPGPSLLAAGFSTGVFGLYQMPDFTTVQILSMSREPISTLDFDSSGEWLAVGCSRLGQLLVWEWRSETYVLKQQGHFSDVAAMDFSSDGALLATGGEDAKVKLWHVWSSFCFATLSDHSLPVTAVKFLPSARALLSSSLDGTVRAWDLLRYRNFRTFTAPNPVQLAALAVDPAGDLVCSSSVDTFQIFVWSMKTGRLLDILDGHEGPVRGLSFSPLQGTLASSSWDKTVRVWDVFESRAGPEPLLHTHEAVTVAFRPDGRQLACATLDGSIQLWDPFEGELQGTIEGARQLAGGRLSSQRRSSSSSEGRHFSSLCYSADGSLLLAVGNSRFLCCYDVAERVLLRRFELSSNKSYDGVLDRLSSRKMTDAGPVDLLEVGEEDEGAAAMAQLPGAVPNGGRATVRALCVRISPTGRQWAVAATGGVMLFSMDQDLLFDPLDLDQDVTPQAVHSAMAAGQHSRSITYALKLNQPALVQLALHAVPPSEVPLVAASIPVSRLASVVAALSHGIQESPSVEFMLVWCQELLVRHGRLVALPGSQSTVPAMRDLLKGLTKLHQDLAQSCEANRYLLEYLTAKPAALVEGSTG